MEIGVGSQVNYFSFSVKSSIDLMEVCRPKSVQPVQPTWSNLQASTNTTSLVECNTSNWVIPAWHCHREHPLIQQLALDFSNSLFLDDNHMPRCQQSVPHRANLRKRKDRSRGTYSPPSKRRRLDCIEENTQICMYWLLFNVSQFSHVLYIHRFMGSLVKRGRSETYLIFMTMFIVPLINTNIVMDYKNIHKSLKKTSIISFCCN